ncbi:family 14 glycosylhydrolase [uncultured Desulfobulbus sp.]|uniref:family 14 glycosylhydrolase n=1 Tax=uncultured Desulfobulbus sp. TaxID=239745 RepID=UPI00374D2240
MTNWASPANGARISAGAKTQFLPPNDLAQFATGNGLIFRHGPRSLEKTLIVELPKPVMVRSVVVSTVYEDTVRVSSGFTVELSMTGADGSWKPAASVDDIHADRTLAAVGNPSEARFVRLSFRDSGGGSRISDIGVYSATPDVVRSSLQGFVYTPGQGWLSIDEITALRGKYGSPKDSYLTMICGGVEYSAPPPQGEGSILSRYTKERGTVWRELQAYSKSLPYYSAMGTRSMEIYVRWNLIEDKPEQFDFSLFDEFEKMFRKNNLKWSPLLLAGPAYTLPDWFRKTDYTPYRCLEHDKDNIVVSLWDPKMKPYIDRFFKAFIKHYGGSDGIIQNLMLGVTGIFGENLYPHESDKDWTTNATGDYHSHSGWWAGDKYARQSFRDYMKRRYTSIEVLNNAWGESYPSFAELEPKTPEKCRTPRAKYDFMDWYIGSMTDYTEFWLKTARKYMPKGDIQLCVGGEGRQRVGTDFSRSAKLAAKYHAGIRITNESPDYSLNIAMTRWISTAARTYGAWLGMEPASLQIQYDSIAQRVFNVRTSGARELFCYQTGLSNRKAYTKLLENMRYLQPDTPTISVAYWMPRTHMMVAGDVDYVWDMRGLRDAVDFDAVDDVLIQDGALDRYKVLVMGAGSIEDERILSHIEKWVEAGGVLIRIRPEPLTTIDGSKEWQSRLFGMASTPSSASWTQAKRVGKGYTLLIPDAYRTRKEIAGVMDRLLSDIGSLGDGFTSPPRVSGSSELYGCLMQKSFMLLNANPFPVTAMYDVPLTDGKRLKGSVVMPEYSIHEVGFPR